MKKTKKRLMLDRETLRDLGSRDLAGVAGGGITASCPCTSLCSDTCGACTLPTGTLTCPR